VPVQVEPYWVDELQDAQVVYRLIVQVKMQLQSRPQPPPSPKNQRVEREERASDVLLLQVSAQLPVVSGYEFWPSEQSLHQNVQYWYWHEVVVVALSKKSS